MREKRGEQQQAEQRCIRGKAVGCHRYVVVTHVALATLGAAPVDVPLSTALR